MSQELLFQEFFPKGDASSSDKQSLETSEKFFELANSRVVSYQIDSKPNSIIKIHQNSSCKSHTGGIVWETAYLLAEFLLLFFKEKHSLGKLLELGSGCGMLGLVLAANNLCTKVVMTETTEVLKNLKDNVEFNSTSKNGCCPQYKVSVQRLRWDKFEKDIKKCKGMGLTDLDPQSFDTVVGTDIIFSTVLVKPLLKTLRKMIHDKSNIYLCVQIRCADSHELFMRKASKYGFKIRDCTNDLESIPYLKWGLEMECKILHMTVIDKSNKKRKKSSKNDGKTHKKRKI